MKFSLYNIIVIIFLINTSITYNDCADVDSKHQEACKHSIRKKLRSHHQMDCLINFFFMGPPADLKPNLPIVLNLTQDVVDNALKQLPTWARYAFYLGEQVIFNGVLLTPYMFCRLKYYSSFIYGEISDTGVIVYPYDYTNTETGKEYKKGDPIELEPNEKDDYDSVLLIGAKYKNFKRDRETCYEKLNVKGFNVNSTRNFSQKHLFDKLYRLRGVYGEHNDKIIGHYCRHAIRVIGLKNGTLDPATYCTMKNLSEVFAESERRSKLDIAGTSGNNQQNPIIVN